MNFVVAKVCSWIFDKKDRDFYGFSVISVKLSEFHIYLVMCQPGFRYKKQFCGLKKLFMNSSESVYIFVKRVNSAQICNLTVIWSMLLKFMMKNSPEINDSVLWKNPGNSKRANFFSGMLFNSDVKFLLY